MKLGVFLAVGESFSDYQKKGQSNLIINYHLKNYSKNFEYVYIFSYANESIKIFPNVEVLPNKYNIHRYIYALILPLIYLRIITVCNVIRGLQLSGGIPAFVAKFFLRKKYVINYGYQYDQFAFVEGKYFQFILYRMVERMVIKKATGVISTTRYLKKYLAKSIPTSKIHYVANGVDTSIFKPTNKRKKWDILFVGRLEKQKNLSLILQAVSLLKDKKIKIIFIGSGSQKQELEQISQQLSLQITFLPAQPHIQLVNYYNSAHIFILPSLIEGQPKVLLEAMSCALPVIASSIPAHQEIIINKQNGILCQPKALDFAKSISYLLLHKKAQNSLGQKARRIITEQYDMKKLNKKEIEILHKASYG